MDTPHDFASRTFFTRRRSTEKIPGLPAASDAFADGGGGHLADIMALSEAPVLPSSHATNRHEAVGVGLPAHSAAMTVEITSGRITAQNLIAALGWKQSQELWAYLNAAGFWELVAERPTDGLALQARVMSRGRTQLAADTRKAMGIEDGDIARDRDRAKHACTDTAAELTLGENHARQNHKAPADG